MYTIRQATVADAETIHMLAHEIWPPTYSPIISREQLNFMLADRYAVDVIAKQIEESVQTYLLLIEEDKPVAFAAFSPDDDPEVYRLHKLYLLPVTQGKGYGKAMLQAVVDRVIDAGKDKLDLNVHRQNPAKSFYDKMGFKVLYEADIPYGPYLLNDFIMRKELR
ncbi:GNAT family N-acetyltransferase [Mucilaginibacter antarcticus]|uniref:GNAT family N-acetyltransferase n=1 Tax=Mucilaginibacter antarcticus TaxID=1855725 RepID=A0ABW5XL49_9SPHI